MKYYVLKLIIFYYEHEETEYFLLKIGEEYKLASGNAFIHIVKKSGNMKYKVNGDRHIIYGDNFEIPSQITRWFNMVPGESQLLFSAAMPVLVVDELEKFDTEDAAKLFIIMRG